MTDIKSVLKPENSIIAGIATVGIVAAIYQLDAGPASQVHASDAYHPANTAGIKKAGYTSLITVAGLGLLARDINLIILGGAAIIAFHAHYRHANAVNPQTNMLESPGSAAYQPAQAVVPQDLQAVA
jgi:hypothetical protein